MSTNASPSSDKEKEYAAAVETLKQKLDAIAKFDVMKDGKFRVEDVAFQGLETTKESVLRREFAKAAQARTLDELLPELISIQKRLKECDVFESVAINPKRGDGKDTVRIAVNVLEQRHRGITLGGYVQEGEFSGATKVRLRNLFGFMERVEVHADSSNQFTAGTSALLSIPFPFGLPGWFTMTGIAQRNNLIETQSFVGLEKGAKFAWKRHSKSNHELGFQSMLRSMSDVPKNSAAQILSAPSIKNSLFHTFSKEVFPSDSTFLAMKSFNELAGIGGNTAFLKTENKISFERYVDLSAYIPGISRAFPWTSSMTLAASVNFGLLRCLSDDHSRIQDRFTLGGHLNMRGFKNKGIGPRAAQANDSDAVGKPSLVFQNDGAIGGEAFYSATLRAETGVPFKVLRRYGIESHAFLSAGNCFTPRITATLNALQQTRFSAGFGIFKDFGGVRAELNYCIPVRAMQHLGDQTAPGLRFGLAMEWM